VGATLSDGETVRARIVVGADGRSSFVAPNAGAADQIREAPTRAMYYRYVRGFTNPAGDAPDGAEFSLRQDELVYAFPSDGGTTCVALSVNLEEFAVLRRDAERGFHARLEQHPGLAPRLRRCTFEGRLLGCGPKDHLVRVPVGPGWALVGDASLHQDPWTGNGMDNAGVHATFLAEAIDGWLSGRSPEDQAFERYHARRDEFSLADLWETIELGRDLRQLATA
jgi:Dehydrogenases (flavoproteins)